MSSRHFSWLLAATVLIGALVVLLPGRTSKDSEIEVQALLPGLAEQVNNINEVQVISAGNQRVATLQRKDDRWVIAEFQDYAANWTELRELLAALAKARIVEPKTANPEYFSRLGVSDVDDAESEATLLKLKGEQLDMAILVGNSAEGREGHYVRLADGDRALLVDQQLDLPAEAKDWLQRDIIDVSDAEVVEYSLHFADGSVIAAAKASADDEDFKLQGIPEGREVLSAWSVNSMANALSNLQLDAVAAADTLDFSAARQFRLLTADRLEVVADLIELEEQDWLRLSARVYSGDAAAGLAEDVSGDVTEWAAEAEQALIETAASEAVVSEDAEGTADAQDAEVAEEAESDVQQRVDDINQRVSGWAYAIPSFKADAMNKQLEDLLKPLAESP